jgi:hypothetical protein
MSRRRLEPDHNPDDYSVPDRRQRPRLASNASSIAIYHDGALPRGPAFWRYSHFDSHFIRYEPELGRYKQITFSRIPRTVNGMLRPAHYRVEDEAIDLSYEPPPLQEP